MAMQSDILSSLQNLQMPGAFPDVAQPSMQDVVSALGNSLASYHGARQGSSFQDNLDEGTARKIAVAKQLQDLAKQGHEDAVAVDQAAYDASNGDPKLYAEIVDEMHSAPVQVNASNARLVAATALSKRGLPMPRSLEMQKLDIEKQRYADEKDYRNEELSLKRQEVAQGGDGSSWLQDAKAISQQTGMPLEQAYAIARNGLGQGVGFTPDGKIVPLNNAPEAVSMMKEGASAGTERGKVLGENQAKLRSMLASQLHVLDVVNQLSDLGKKATYTAAGRGVNATKRELGFPVGEGGIAREKYISKVKDELFPLLRQTFGAQFTKAEGDSLLTTLGDPNKTPEEKDAALTAFIEGKVGQIQSLQRETGSESPPAASPPKRIRFDANGNMVE